MDSEAQGGTPEGASPFFFLANSSDLFYDGNTGRQQTNISFAGGVYHA